MQPKAAANTPKELGKPINPPCQVTRVRFSPDSKILAAACTDGTIRRWDVSGKEPAELPVLTGHNGWVTQVVFGKDTLLSSDSWGRLSAHDASGKQLWTIEAAHDGWLRMIAAPPIPTSLVTCGKDGFVRTWAAKDGKKLGEINVKADVLCVCFAPDGKLLYTGDLFGIIRTFDPATGKPGRTFEAKEYYLLHRIQDVGGVRCLLFDPTGKTLITAGAEPKTGGFVQAIPLMIAFDVASGKRLWQWKGASESEGYVTDLAWHPGGFIVATTSGQPGQGKVFFLKPGEASPFFVSAKPNCHSVAISADGARMAVAMTNANSSGNGKVKGKGGEYPANISPLQLWQLR